VTGTRTVRVGLVGFGFIGAGLYRAIVDRQLEGLSVAFVWNRSAGKLDGVPAELVLADLARAADAAPDLIVESAIRASRVITARRSPPAATTCRSR